MALASATPKYLSRASGSMNEVAVCTMLGSMWTGKEMKSTAQPMSGVQRGLLPWPPKSILPKSMALTAPMTTIHQGAPAGSMKA